MAGYDRKARVDWDAELALLRETGLNEHSCLVDLGAGTGRLAVAAAPFCKRVVAVDVSPAMQTATREEVKRLELRNVECVQAGFLSYVHRGELANFVYTRHALHQIPDFWKAMALQRTRAMMPPGGVLRLRDLIFSFEPVGAGAAIEPWLERAAQSSENGWTRAELEEHLRNEYSTFTWLLEPMLERAGFTIQQAKYDPSGIYAAYVCVAR